MRIVFVVLAFLIAFSSAADATICSMPSTESYLDTLTNRGSEELHERLKCEGAIDENGNFTDVLWRP